MSTETADAGPDTEVETDPSAEWACDCGATFETAAGLGGHKSSCDSERGCATCVDLETGSFAWYLHQTDEHGRRFARLDYLKPGAFEAAVDRAESVLDVAEDLGWQIDRVFRALHIYGFEDRVGPTRGGER